LEPGKVPILDPLLTVNDHGFDLNYTHSANYNQSKLDVSVPRRVGWQKIGHP
jgi:hypothetical protein